MYTVSPQTEKVQTETSRQCNKKGALRCRWRRVVRLEVAVRLFEELDAGVAPLARRLDWPRLEELALLQALHAVDEQVALWPHLTNVAGELVAQLDSCRLFLEPG